MGKVQKAKKVPKDVLRKCEDLGDSAEGRKRSPRLSLLGIVAKRQKVIPKDIMEKVWSNLTGREQYGEDII